MSSPDALKESQKLVAEVQVVLTGHADEVVYNVANNLLAHVAIHMCVTRAWMLENAAQAFDLFSQPKNNGAARGTPPLKPLKRAGRARRPRRA